MKKFIEFLKMKASFLKGEIVSLWIALQDKRTPWYTKAFVGFTVFYALSPIDFIPDFIPLLGYLDDLIILPILISLSIKLMPRDVLKESRDKARSKQVRLSRKWYYVLPIVGMWLLCILLLLRWL